LPLKALLHAFSLATVVDVALATLIVRLLLGWLMGNRRLARLLVILLGLAGFLFFVQRANLPVTQILAAALVVPVACLAVMNFLPDLRRAYQAASLRRLFARRDADQENPLPALTAAVVELARLRRGAILVFPRGDDVDSFLNGGEEYDALVTKSLLLSLFHPACPRHDGAMVIRRGRVVRVGAFLPLSLATPLPEEWGTRHLAALGLAERCDADVVVVSEERGSVSHARAGEMAEIVPVDAERIGLLLGSILRADGFRGRPRRTRLLSAAAWVLAFVLSALAAPAVAWLNPPAAAERDPSPLATFQVPIYFTHVPDHLYVENPGPLLAKVELRLSNREVVFSPNFGIAIDLRDTPPGTSTITLTPRMFYDLPPAWQIERYDPEQIRVTLVEAHDRSLAVEPVFTGLAPGLHVVSSVTVPAAVAVRIKDDRSTLGLTLKTLPVDLVRFHRPGSYALAAALDLPPAIAPRPGVPETVRVSVTLGR